MAVAIRKAELEDFQSVYQFICELQKKKFDEDILKQLYVENLSKPENIYLVASQDELVIGYLSCHIQTLLHHAGKVAEIQEIFVAADYRSSGVGKLLIDEIKSRSTKFRALQLEVTTRKIREKAIQFYIRESFEDSHNKLVYYF
jgi:PhnO protein